MPLYAEDEKKNCTIDFGDGRSLIIELKDSFGSVESARQFIALSKKAAAAEKNIARLEAKQESVESLDEFNKLQGQIEEWRKIPDSLTLLTEFIFAAGKGWDNYASREDEEKGNALPFTKEQIGKISIKGLERIANRLLAESGLVSEDEDPKASPSKSEPPLYLENTVQ